MKLSALSALVLCSLFLTGCQTPEGGEDSSKSWETPSGVKIEILKEGDGAEVEQNSNVVVHYKGTLEDGTVFDSSYDRGAPLSVTVGIGRVIKGWDEGLIGMKEGEVRKLTIPHHLAYGEAGRGPIPPKATLIFETELLKIAEDPVKRGKVKEESE